MRVVVPFCLFLLAFGNVSSQSYFVKNFGDTLITETGIAAIQVKKGFIYYAGTVTDTAVNRTDVSFIKMDKNGNVLWTKIFSTVNSDYCNDMMLTHDSAFILTCYVYDFTNGNSDWLMLKVDTAGNLVWLNTKGKPTIGEMFSDVELTTDKGFIACGSLTDTTGGTGNNLYLVKFDSLCNKQWEKNYGTTLNDYAMAVKQSLAGDYILTGDKLLSSGIYNAVIMKTDASGLLTWSTDLASAFNSGCKNFIITSAGDYLVVGESSTAKSSKFDTYYSKVSSAGNIYWQRTIGNVSEAEAAFSLYEYSPNRFVVSGYGEVNSEGKTKVILQFLDSSANELYRKYYNNRLVSIGYTISPSVYGGYIISGMSTGVEDQYLLVVDSIPLNVGIDNFSKSFGAISFYPNPAREKIVLISGGFMEEGQMIVTDILGKSVHEATMYSDMLEIDCASWPAGIYLFQLRTNEGIRTGKIVKVNY